ncbi:MULTISPECIES: hypothetical protein [Sphingobacterium]|uniref:FEKKY domain-containing protein n=1 Tax=Sphingobacterium TaxID=28453 RepID=UPI0013DACCB4|nr:MULTISPECIES: hypothetical protein [unclassified Sphingobacterium]
MKRKLVVLPVLALVLLIIMLILEFSNIGSDFESTSIVFIIFSSYYLIKMFIFCFGLYNDFNYFKAVNDLQNGKIQLLQAGQYYYSCDEEYNAIDSLYTSYGIATSDIGIVTPGMYRYNAVVEMYLSNKYGENWNEKFGELADSIRNIYCKE